MQQDLTLTVPGPSPLQPQCRLALTLYGAQQGVRQLVMCVHGLARQRHDFNALALALVQQTGVAVAAVDVVGRGDSDSLQDPMLYSLPVYVPQLLSVQQQLVQRLQPTVVDWVGTSMGGLIGLGVGAAWAAALNAGRQADTAFRSEMALGGAQMTAQMTTQWASAKLVPMRRMVLNDVGPRIASTGLARIGEYVGKHMQFADEATAIAHLSALSSGFGPLTEAQRWTFHRPMLRKLPNGGVRLHYDPKIALLFTAVNATLMRQGEAMLWQIWDALPMQVLIVRGAHSDLLSQKTVREMQARKPGTLLYVVPDCGHAPSLLPAEQISVLQRFLSAPETKRS